MRSAFALLVLASGALAKPMPQGVTDSIAPSSPPPAGCQTSRDGSFQITVVNVTKSASKRDLQPRQANVLTLNLKDSVLKDQNGRTGYIAANYQFQFDAPAQTGAIYTSGFSVCGNNTLALGGSAIFYQCLSGEFYNLYDRSWAPQCSPIYIIAVNGGSTGGGGASQISDGQPQATGAVTQIPDGQPQATPIHQISDGQIQMPTGGSPVSQISDGQPQAPTGVVSQISDGQPQAPSAAPVTQISDGQPQAPSAAPVTQISDGQPQAPSATPVTQISDGQPQAPTPVSQIPDGQPQAPTGTPVSQISDGQPQAPIQTSAPVVSQISDGQPQAPTPTSKLVSQITDGQIQAPATSSAPAAFTGAAAVHDTGAAGTFAIVAGIAGAVALL